ncbi:MAG: IS110 family transposase [Myxococcales bacterium]|nr:IS110 family transposase [Myxococcales bacterium]
MTRATPYPDTITTPVSRLHLVFELSNSTWKLGFALTRNGKLRERNVPARDLAAVFAEIDTARRHFKLSEDAPVVACYEAGRDGFWLYRALTAVDVECAVVDPASILVDRRRVHAKTDRLDLKALRMLLVRYAEGERDVWRVVKVPPAEVEDLRLLGRERKTIVEECTAHVNRVRSMLSLYGVTVEGSVSPRLASTLPAIVGPSGDRLGPAAQGQIRRELERIDLATKQIREIEKQLRELFAARQREALGRRVDELGAAERATEQARRLQELRGIGQLGAFTLATEFFGWRQFKNRKQVAALAGLAPVPHQSGDMDRERNISKAGNPRIRALVVQLAWGWLRHQPQSALSREFRQRTEEGKKRGRRRAIVALARKLLVALWRYLDHGVIPDGAIFSPGVRAA